MIIKRAFSYFNPVILAAFMLIMAPQIGSFVTTWRSQSSYNQSDSIDRLMASNIILPENVWTGNQSLTVIFLPRCNSCSFTSEGDLKIPNLPDADVVISPDALDSKLLDRYKKSRKNRLTVLIDPTEAMASKEMYDLAPVLATVSNRGVPTNIRLIRETL